MSSDTRRLVAGTRKGLAKTWGVNPKASSVANARRVVGTRERWVAASWRVVGTIGRGIGTTERRVDSTKGRWIGTRRRWIGTRRWWVSTRRRWIATRRGWVATRWWGPKCTKGRGLLRETRRVVATSGRRVARDSRP